jgi:hypothetical protein
VSCKLFFNIFVPWLCGFINLKLGTLCLMFKKERRLVCHDRASDAFIVRQHHLNTAGKYAHAVVVLLRGMAQSMTRSQSMMSVMTGTWLAYESMVAWVIDLAHGLRRGSLNFLG